MISLIHNASFENYKLLIDSLGICFYLGQTLMTHGHLLPQGLAEAYSAATGIEVSGKDLLETAERSNQIERAINSLQGLDRRQDSFTRRPEKDSWAQGIDLDRPGMLDEYYECRGLSKRGLPTLQRLLDAKLDDLASDLQKNRLVDSYTDSDHYRALNQIIKNPSILEIGRGLKAKKN